MFVGVHVCTSVCPYVCACVQIYVPMHVCTCVSIGVPMCTHVGMGTFVCAHILSAHVYMCMSIRVRIFVYACMFVCA